jgi:hypothetical protein
MVKRATFALHTLVIICFDNPGGLSIGRSSDEAESDVQFGGRYRANDLQSSDSMILNVTWYLYSEMLKAHGDSAKSSVVLVTDDVNMLHWAKEWKLPATSYQVLAINYSHENTTDLSSAEQFLRCAGITDSAISTGENLREMLAKAQVRDTKPQIELMELVSERLALLQSVEDFIQKDNRESISMRELRDIFQKAASNLLLHRRPQFGAADTSSASGTSTESEDDKTLKRLSKLSLSSLPDEDEHQAVTTSDLRHKVNDYLTSLRMGKARTTGLAKRELSLESDVHLARSGLNIATPGHSRSTSQVFHKSGSSSRGMRRPRGRGGRWT